ncbi:MAG: hypothetical protein IJ406_04195 [Oscillospiraceae bacterium]|nr:hypothetical protein [Oscillospiraceae bacterium]
MFAESPTGRVSQSLPVGQPNVNPESESFPDFFMSETRIRTQSSPLAVPKNPFGIRLAIFDRCAKDCSLNRPQGAFRNLCPWGNQLVTASALPVLFFYAHSDSNPKRQKTVVLFLQNSRQIL